MENYKEINQELIRANQQQKTEISAYQREIASLQQQLLEEHSCRVLRERAVRTLLVENFKTTIAAIDPDCSLINLLQDACGGEHTEFNENPRRRFSTAEIYQELRQSNMLQHRNSIVSSPRRRSSSPQQIDSSNSAATTLRPQLDVDSEHLADDSELLEKEDTIVISPNPPQILGCIAEEWSETSLEPESDQTVSDSEPESPQVEVLETCKKRGRPRKPLEDVSNLNGTSIKISTKEDATLISKELSSKSSNVIVKRGKRRSLGAVAAANNMSNGDSIGQVRRYEQPEILLNDEPYSFQDRNTKTGTFSMELTEKNETSSNIGMSAMLSELSIRNIADAPSSTPNRTLVKQNKEESSSSTTLRSSSRRKCKPQNFKEPRINAKQRNENSTVSQSNKTSNRRKKK